MKVVLHVVGLSSLPVVGSVGVLGFVLGVLCWVKFGIFSFFFFQLLFLLYTLGMWLKDVVMEGVSGCHGQYLDWGFKFGFIIFLFTEVMFFFSLFWYFFDKFFFGGVWWPVESGVLDCWGLPLLGTIFLLSSGLMCTWAHGSVSNKKFVVLLLGTIFLGVLFMCLQIYEYWMLSFNMSDGVYGSVFFFCTGFHGLHVSVGLIILGVSLLRFVGGYLTWDNFFFFEGSAVYWHFVDVVWLILFLVIYV